MANLSISMVVDATGARKRFDLLTDSYKDLTPVLAELSKFKQGKISELFASSGNGKWPPRSERSEQRGSARTAALLERAPETLKRKLGREYGRALKRQARGKGKANTVARRAFVLAEFERQVESGHLNVAAFEHEDKRLQKSVRGLATRMGRAEARAAARGQALGALPQTIRAAIKGGTLTIDSSWESPAPRALQDGATVGHGAELPARPFLFWEESDADYFRILLLKRGLIAWGR